jgi:hypothetical protein
MTEYRSVLKDSAETIIKRAKILKEAEDKLGEKELSHTFKEFCEELLGVKPEHSTVRKMLKIGKEASRFYPVLDQLSDNWTTIYKLATLEEDKFNRLTDDERFTPKTTAKDIDKICPPEPKKPRKKKAKPVEPTDNEPKGDDVAEPTDNEPSKVKTVNIIAKVRLDLDAARKQELHNRLQALGEEFGVEFDLTQLAA